MILGAALTIVGLLAMFGFLMLVLIWHDKLAIKEE